MKLKKFLCSAVGLMLCHTALLGQTIPSESNREWKPVAQYIVGDATDKREQAYRIYRWLCDNIAYDTGHTVSTADECYDRRRGVCQGYTELFCRIAAEVGLKTEIVSGKVKDPAGAIDDEGHAWLFVYTAKKTGILVDPTWGAGSVDNGVFTRSENDDSWFDVDPYWMIFSHFPKKENFQNLPKPIDYGLFCSLPSYHPNHGAFGQDARRLFEQCRNGGTPDLPDYYPTMLPWAEVVTMPQEGTLRIGQSYGFAFRQRRPAELMVQNGTRQSFSGEWQQADGCVSCRFMPSEEAPVTVAVRTGENAWNVLAQYRIAPPTSADIESLEASLPQHSPVFGRTANFSARTLAEHGVDFAALLAEVKAQAIGRLPVIYGGTPFSVREIPWNGTLRVGQAYTFRIAPGVGGRWAVINEGDWYMEWADDDGVRSITVTPQKAGKLQVASEIEGTESFRYCIEYLVE